MSKAFECSKCGNGTPDLTGKDPCIVCVARRLSCRADTEPPMSFQANARWLDDEIRASRAHGASVNVRVAAINAWLRMASMCIQRGVQRTRFE